MVMKEQLDSFLKTKQDFIVEFKKWCADKSVDVNERWDLFILSKLGDVAYPYESPFEDWDPSFYMETLCYDKCQTIDVEGLLTSVKEYISDYYELDLEDEEFVPDSSPDWVNQFNEEEYKEFFLQQFIKSFKLDW
jgi:hypothetical protein